MFFNEDHLRITKVRTVNGTTPMTGVDERPIKKTIFAPLNKDTKKLFEDQNKRLPNNIKMKIEVVRAYKPEQIAAPTPVEISILEQKNKDQEALIEQLMEQNKKLQEKNIETGSQNLSNTAEVSAEAKTDPLKEDKSKKEKQLA